MRDLSRDFQGYNPGHAYWDIFAFDVYGNGFDRDWNDCILPVVGDKPMVIGDGECERLPGTRRLTAQPGWCFFISCGELNFARNSNEQILEVYGASSVVSRDQLPKFK